MLDTDPVEKRIEYNDIRGNETEIKENFLKQCVDKDCVFVKLQNGIIYHVLKSFEELSVSAFKEDDFDRFMNNGTVIAFKKSHEGLEAAYNGTVKVTEFMRLNLTDENYFEFEKWMFNQL